MWDYRSQRPFVVSFLYVYSFPKRINMSKLIEMGIFNGVNDAPRGFRLISKDQFEFILKETLSESGYRLNQNLRIRFLMAQKNMSSVSRSLRIYL